MIFGRRKQRLSHEDFIDAYENEHQHLTARLIEGGTIPPMLEYRGNDIRHNDPLDAGACGFDVGAQAVFAYRTAYKANRAGLNAPELARVLTEDLARKFDPESLT